MVNFPNLRIAYGDRDIARRAALLRAQYHLRSADALQAAACILEGGEALISNDRQLARLQPTLPVVILADSLPG